MDRCTISYNPPGTLYSVLISFYLCKDLIVKCSPFQVADDTINVVLAPGDGLIGDEEMFTIEFMLSRLVNHNNYPSHLLCYSYMVAI